MKKILSILMLSFTLLLSFSMVAFAGDISVNVNGQPLAFQEKPIVKNGRTLVPMREIFEILGAELNWDAGTKTITAKKDGTEIKMQIGSKDITIGNETKTLDVEPQIINGRTMVPVRAISEALGTKVVYNEKNQIIVVITPGKETDLTKKANKYLANHDIYNNYKDSIAVIEKPKTVDELKVNYNALPVYDMNNLPKKGEYKMMSLEQVVTIDPAETKDANTRSSYPLFYEKDKSRILATTRLKVYNSPITFKKFKTTFLSDGSKKISYKNDIKELRGTVFTIDYIKSNNEREDLIGIAYKDNIAVGIVTVIPSTPIMSIVPFDLMYEGGFDSISLNVPAMNFFPNMEYTENYLKKQDYVSVIIDLPEINYEEIEETW
jgi:hypothetical protein